MVISWCRLYQHASKNNKIFSKADSFQVLPNPVQFSHSIQLHIQFVNLW